MPSKFQNVFFFCFLAVIGVPIGSDFFGIVSSKLAPPETSQIFNEDLIVDNAFTAFNRELPDSFEGLTALANFVMGHLVVDRLVKIVGSPHSTTDIEISADDRRKIRAATALTEILLRRLPNGMDGDLFGYQRNYLEKIVTEALALGITTEDEMVDEPLRALSSQYLIKIGSASIPHLIKILGDEIHLASEAHDHRRVERILWAVYKTVRTMEVVIDIKNLEGAEEHQIRSTLRLFLIDDSYQLVPVLVLALTYGDVTGRKIETAIQLLKNLDDPAVMEYLSKVLLDETWLDNSWRSKLIISRALKTLEGIGWPALEVLSELENTAGLRPEILEWIQSSIWLILTGQTLHPLMAASYDGLRFGSQPASYAAGLVSRAPSLESSL